MPRGGNDIIDRLKASATQARAIDRSELLLEAAKEIERLLGVIDTYCESSAAASREINMLREKLERMDRQTNGRPS